MAIADRYDVEGPMGEGGFAHVFRGLERATGRPVALKVLKTAFHDNKEVRERFQREVFAVASLSNRHIVGLYDFGLNESDVYIAMEYVAGATLRERMRSPLTLAERFAIVAQVADAIAAAHASNILHRDLKPENIKVVDGPDGSMVVKVLDFGMAKISELESSLELQPLTRAGICFGTPHYMSPEQIRGRLDEPAIDLYALTTIAYELLSGGRPWDGDDPYEVMRAVLRTPAPPLAHLRGVVGGQDPQVLADVNAFFVRAFDKQRENRPQDAAALVLELERALFGVSGAPAVESSAYVHVPHPDDTSKYASHNTQSLMLHLPHPDTIDDVVTETSSPALVPVVERVRPRRSAVEIEARQAAALAAVEFGKTRKRGFFWPLVIIAILGGSIGWLLANSGTSTAADQVHDFLVGKK
ncbi:MAG: serine/threonine-protein kinase [Polyangia bacterium]